MALNLSETGIKQAIHSSLTEELRTMDKSSRLPDENNPREKAHEGWILITSHAIASRIFNAIEEKDKNNGTIKQIGIDKVMDILRVSHFSKELETVILEITRRTLEVLLPD